MEITADLQRQIDEYENNRTHRVPISDELRQYYDELAKEEIKKRQEIKRSLEEHNKKIEKVAYAIHELITENHLSVRDAKMILGEAIKRIERYSHVMAIEYDFEDIRNLVRSGYIRPICLEENQLESENQTCRCLPSNELCQGISVDVCSQKWTKCTGSTK